MCSSCKYSAILVEISGTALKMIRILGVTFSPNYKRESVILGLINFLLALGLLVISSISFRERPLCSSNLYAYAAEPKYAPHTNNNNTEIRASLGVLLFACTAFFSLIIGWCALVYGIFTSKKQFCVLVRNLFWILTLTVLSFSFANGYFCLA